MSGYRLCWLPSFFCSSPMPKACSRFFTNLDGFGLQDSNFNFWTWLGIKDLMDAPVPAIGGFWERLFHWWEADRTAATVDSWKWVFTGLDKWLAEQFMPERYLWWWRASRVISDYDLVNSVNSHAEIIDEFPAFSFVLGDLHPHVLSLPFNMLGIGVALNVFLGGWRGAIRFLGLHLRITPRDFFFAALVLGGLAFLNTWDILVSAALIVGAYILMRVREDGWGWARLEDAFLLGIPLAVASIILYLPFYIGFSSQAGGLLPNLVNPTRGAHLWVMWGLFSYHSLLT